jgi:uncharacterized protein (TIGR03382 family)
MGDVSGIPRSWPAALFPPEVTDDGVRYVLGPVEPGAANAVTAAGQAIPLSPEPGDALYLLVAAAGDRDATFRVGDREFTAALMDWTGWVGQWDSRVPDPLGDPVMDPADILPAFVRPGEVGLFATHRHRPDGDEPFVFCYLQRLVLPVPEGALELVLPGDGDVRVLAATLAPSALAQAVAATPLHDRFDVDAYPLPWEDAPPPGPGPEPEPADVAAPPDTAAPPADTGGQDGTRGGGGCTAGPVSSTVPMLLVLLVAALASRRRIARRSTSAGTAPARAS